MAGRDGQGRTARKIGGCLPLVPVVVGPTAVGKTAAALILAQANSMEVVSADSRQIYRRMDIGTGKPSSDETACVPHHLIDVIEPWEAYSCGRYRREALSAVQGIVGRGKTPLVVGGSGLYLRALEKGLFEGPERDEGLRSELRAAAERLGREHLHQRLAGVDPEAASNIHPRNIERVIRALEVYEATGTPISELRKRSHLKSPFKLVTVGLTRRRERLYGLINERFDAMLERGLVEEVRRLIAGGFSEAWPSFRTVGYREITLHLRGELPYQVACEKARTATRRFAKRQLTWFARSPVEVWLDIEDGESPAETSRRILRVFAQAGAV
jgi:tRNA dimethylallyltransferase